MTSMKRCKQCGILKSEEEFRLYTYSRKKETQGRRNECKTCEAINAKYIRAKETGDLAEVERIMNLYTMLEAKGLHTPLSRKPRESVEDEVDAILAFHNTNGAVPRVSPILCAQINVDMPSELEYWINSTFEDWIEDDISPEYLQETIYESLKAKYRPQVGVDRDRFVPLYDDTYKDILNSILKRFDEYEDMMSSEEAVYNDKA